MSIVSQSPSKNQSSAPLGISTVYSAPPENKGLQGIEFDPVTGEIKATKKERTDFIVQKYALQSAAKEILGKNHRINSCLNYCRIKGGDVSVYKSKEHDSTHYGGLMVCGLGWVCPVCASKISEVRKDEIQGAISGHLSSGGKVVMRTGTYSHALRDPLSDQLEKLNSANNGFHISKPIKRLKESIGFEGYIRVVEMTYSFANGWHPHIHEIWFIRTDESYKEVCERVKEESFSVWRKYILKKGLGEPSWEHGLDVRPAEDAHAYVTKMGKWTASHELAKANTKIAKKNSFTPFGLLEQFLVTGDDRWVGLFREFANATHRKKQIQWSNELAKKYKQTEKTDEQIANSQEEEAKLLGVIEFKDWRRIVRFNCRAEVLVLARKGWSNVERLVKRLIELENRKEVIRDG